MDSAYQLRRSAHRQPRGDPAHCQELCLLSPGGQGWDKRRGARCHCMESLDSAAGPSRRETTGCERVLSRGRSSGVIPKTRVAGSLPVYRSETEQKCAVAVIADKLTQAKIAGTPRKSPRLWRAPPTAPCGAALPGWVRII